MKIKDTSACTYVLEANMITSDFAEAMPMAGRIRSMPKFYRAFAFKGRPERKDKSPAEQQIDRAVEQVYQTYGPNLSVFFAAVRRQDALALEKHAREGGEPSKRRSDEH